MKYVSERLTEFREKEAGNVITIFLFIFALLSFNPVPWMMDWGLIIFWLAVFLSIIDLSKNKTSILKVFLNILLVISIGFGLGISFNIWFS